MSHAPEAWIVHTRTGSTSVVPGPAELSPSLAISLVAFVNRA